MTQTALKRMDAVRGNSLSALDVEMHCEALIGAEAAGS